jgi:hypothetical protein
MICMWTRGMTPLVNAVKGSIATGVWHLADVPVAPAR